MGHTLPEFVICDECGSEARVRSCGRVEYDWPETSTDGQLATMPRIRWARLTVDCPHCGVKPQDVKIGGVDSMVNSNTNSTQRRLSGVRIQQIRFRTTK